MDEYLAKTIMTLRKEASDKTIEASRLERLQQKYPDLTPHSKGRSPARYYCSTQINSIADKLTLDHSCGCCTDSTLSASAYIDTPDGKVYGKPLTIPVGEQHHMGGDYPYPKWRDKLQEAGYSSALIERVAAHFRKCQEERIKEASEALEVAAEPDPLL